MKRAFILGVTLGTALFLSLAACGIGWSEMEAGPSLRVVPTTGDVVLGFFLWLKYDSPPACTELVTQWTIFLLGDGTREVLVDETRPPRKSCVGLKAVSTFSSLVTPLPGAQYEAHVFVEDRVNRLSYERTFSYIAPLSLPAGIVLKAKDGEILDLSAVDDRELEQMAGLYDLFSTAYTKDETQVSVADFFAGQAASPEAFPAWVFVVVAPAPTLDFGGLNLPIVAPPNVKLAYDRILYIYVVPSIDAVSGLLDQLAEFETEFLGQILVNTGTPSTTEPAAVYLHAAAWEILEMAKEEYGRRHPAEE